MGWVRNFECPGSKWGHLPVESRCIYCTQDVQVTSKRGRRSRAFTQERFIIEEEP